MLKDYTEFTLESLKYAIEFNSKDQPLFTLFQLAAAKAPEAIKKALQNYGELRQATIFQHPFIQFIQLRYFFFFFFFCTVAALILVQEEEIYIRFLFKDSQFLEVRRTPNMGKGVFAKQGTIILYCLLPYLRYDRHPCQSRDMFCSEDCCSEYKGTFYHSLRAYLIFYLLFRMMSARVA
jgi:hypothetical protein